MSEKIEQHSALKTENEKNFPSLSVLGWTIKYEKAAGAEAVASDREQQTIVVNTDRFENRKPARLRQIGILAAAREVALEESIRGTNPKEAVQLFSENKEFTGELLRFTGARILKERDPKVAKEILDILPLSNSVVSEFKTACAFFLARGEFPKVTKAVADELEKLPVSSKTGEHLLSSLTSKRVALARKHDYFERFIAPAIKRLRQVDADLRASVSEDFQPSTDSSLEERELDESEIMQRIEPFVGGYFREKVMDSVDWKSMRMVASGVQAEKLLPSEEARVLLSDVKIQTFRGINGGALKKGPLTAPLPASAEVFPETATRGLILRRSTNGTHTIEWGKGVNDQQSGGEPPETYEFQFGRKREPLEWQKIEPTEAEQGVPAWVLETLSTETTVFLEELRNARVTDAAKVRQIAQRVQTSIEYVNDDVVGAALSAAGERYFTTLEEIKKGDCDVSNFYALAQLRGIGIPCRMITGFHVNRDKRFSFAALAGTKHAWLEWWDDDKKLWERIDATPPKSPEEEKDDGEEGGGGENKDNMNLSDKEEPKAEPEEPDDDAFGLPFKDDDLALLKERLAELPEVSEKSPDTGRIFEDLYGIPRSRWDEVRAFAEEVGRESLPKEATIDGRAASTVAEEWKRIFDLLFIAYRMPSRSRRIMMGRESRGGELVDPVSAGVDVLIGADDPYGFEQKRRREKTEYLPTRFSNDFLLDITASMTAKNQEGHNLLWLERQFVLSSLYEGYKLNERIKQCAGELFARPLISHHILSIHGGAKWQEILRNAPAELKELAAVDEALKNVTSGAGAMAEAIEEYVRTLIEDAATVAALKKGEMVKTLTIITDGNLWCSACGKESCNYELHGPTLDRTRKALEKARELGVIINAIGFTERSRPVAKLFAVEGDKEAAAVVENLGEALAAHYRQTVRVMRPVAKAAQSRIDAGRQAKKE